MPGAKAEPYPEPIFQDGSSQTRSAQRLAPHFAGLHPNPQPQIQPSAIIAMLDLSSLPRLGIDISKLTFDAQLCLHAGRHHGTFANTPAGFAQLESWLKAHQSGTLLAGLEATGPYSHALLAHLHAQGHHVCHLNPRRVKDFARSQGWRVKTDRVDAGVLAAYLRHPERLQLWQPPAQELVELQALVRRRQQVLAALHAENNRMEDPCLPALVAKSLQRQIRHLKAELATLTKAIADHVAAHESLAKSVRLLRSVPGIGPTVAVTLLAEVPNIEGFARARELAAHAGLTPRVAESGTSVRRRGAMTREGSALLRKMLYMSALQAAKRPANAFHAGYRQMVERGKAKMVAIGALMHKILRVAYGVLKHQTPFAENLARLT